MSQEKEEKVVDNSPSDSKETIPLEIPEEFLVGPKKPSTFSFRCFNCLFILFILTFIGSIILLRWGEKFIKKDLLSTKDIAGFKTKLSSTEKEDLSKQLYGYEEVVNRVSATGKFEDYNMVLTGNQANYLLQQIDPSPRPKGRSKVRIIPKKDEATVYLSIPFNRRKYINVILKGVPSAKNYIFDFNVESIQVGNLKKGGFFKKKVLMRMRREFEQIPESLNLPFRIKTLNIKDSKIYVTLTIKR